jgi:aspartyl-tRNA(Asn)/glutamyl-tRNA(Gln) amidotransferase subunit C
MSVTRDDVQRIARLAELDVEEDALDDVAADMSRILDYVAQLQEAPGDEAARPFGHGADALRVRPDAVRPAPLAFGPEAMAPAFRDGFFLVPRLGQFEEDGA